MESKKLSSDRFNQLIEELKGMLATNAEVAELLRKDRRTIDNWARQKRFPNGSVLEIPGGNRLFRIDLILKGMEKNYSNRRV